MEERQSPLSSMGWKRLQLYLCVRPISRNSMFSNFCHVVKSIFYLVRLVSPRVKGTHCFLLHKHLHRELPSFAGKGKFIVDEGVVETYSLDIVFVVTEIDFVDVYPVDGTEAHGQGSQEVKISHPLRSKVFSFLQAARMALSSACAVGSLLP